MQIKPPKTLHHEDRTTVTAKPETNVQVVTKPTPKLGVDVGEAVKGPSSSSVGDKVLAGNVGEAVG